MSTSTPAAVRRSLNKKSLTSEVVTPTRRLGTHASEESARTNLSRSITKRKHSISPLPHTPITIKKRTKNDSSIKKTHSKRKESKTEENESEDEDNKQKKSTVPKRKLNLDLSSKFVTVANRKNKMPVFKTLGLMQVNSEIIQLNFSMRDSISIKFPTMIEERGASVSSIVALFSISDMSFWHIVRHGRDVFEPGPSGTKTKRFF